MEDNLRRDSSTHIGEWINISVLSNGLSESTPTSPQNELPIFGKLTFSDGSSPRDDELKRRQTALLHELHAASAYDPDFQAILQTYIKKNLLGVEELSEVAAAAASHKTKFIGLPLEKLAKLAMLRNPILHIGLFDCADEHVLRLSLFDAAGRPPDNTYFCRPFNVRDRSTWSLQELNKLSMKGLAELQCYAGPCYTCVINMFLRIQKLDEETCNNVMPLHENFFPVDKSSLRGFSSSLQFRLLESVFESGTFFNSREQLQELRGLLFGEPQEDNSQPWQRVATKSYELTTSPLNAVTLSDAARANAAIPMSASFYSFCHPVSRDTSITQHITKSKTKIVADDPFVKWLTVGAFIYFDFQFDVIGINAVSFEESEESNQEHPEYHHTKSAICLGESSLLPLSAIQPLHEWGRWAPVSEVILEKSFGFTHFAWITPSEFIGDHIFPKSGGFTYLHRSDVHWEQKGKEVELHLTGTQKSRFFPVVQNETAVEHVRTTEDGKSVMVRKSDLGKDPYGVYIVRKLAQTRQANKFRPLLYNTPLHIDELLMDEQPMYDGADKFGLCSPEQAIFAAGANAAYGLPQVLGYADESDLICKLAAKFNVEPSDREGMIRKETEALLPDVLADLVRRNALWLRSSETPADFAEELLWNMHYILDGEAKEEVVTGNNSLEGMKRDYGHNGWTLARFHAQEPSRLAQLTLGEVAALRLYTSSTFRVINGPLRANCKPHPLAATTLLISNALKKLRACHMDKRNFKSLYLWRGMRDRTVSDDFMLKGGTELACMSTSGDLRVVASYARSKVPLLLRFKVDSPMELGADLTWLSLFPGEAEVLYPPLTFVKPLFRQYVKGSEGGIVVTVKPSFPS